jgi:hypothetical protein
MPRKDISDDIEESFYEELGCVFDKFPRYDIKFMLSDFNMKVGREDIFKLISGMRVRTKLVTTVGLEQYNLPCLKTLLSKVLCSLIATFINTSRPLLRERHTTR